jgi:NADH-quinone oxidoreductase subunit C
MEHLLRDLDARFAVTEPRRQRDNLAFVRVEAGRAVDLITHLRDREGYTHLVFLTAVDVIEQGVFRLTYLLHNYDSRSDIGVEVEVNRENSKMESIHTLWAQAGTYQRELKEMFGIDFPGSPRVDEPFILESWDDIPPMRREFDTKAYSEARYVPRPGRTTHDTTEHMKEKLYPEEDI